MTKDIYKMSVKDLLLHIEAIEQENKELKTQNDFLQKQNTELKKQYDEFYTEEYLKRIDECNDLWGELFDIKHMSVWEFANKYCNETQLEEAGKAFAKELLGGA